MSLLGLYYQALDPNGRLVIPTRLRNVLDTKYHNSRVMITAWEGILYIYPYQEFEAVLELALRLDRIDRFNPSFLGFRRAVVASAVEVDVDRQGRLQIPQEMRARAHLDREIAVLGNIDVIEVYERQRWETYSAELDAKAPEIRAEISQELKRMSQQLPVVSGGPAPSSPSG